MLVGFTGNMGTGKTLSMVIHGYALHRRFNVPVFANFDTTFSMPVHSWDDIYRINNGVLMLDEAHVAFDSRAFKDDHGRTHFILQTRKKNLLVMFTTQHISQVDKRLRNVCDYVVICKKSGDKVTNQVIEFLSDKIGRKIKLHGVSRFYGLYDTYELVFQFEKSKRGWGSG